MLPLTKIGKIKKRFSILEFIESQGIPLKKNGTGYVCHCPFHQDSTPSLRITPEKGLWNCFGCNKGGDVITFYQYLKGIDNKQAIQELASLESSKALRILDLKQPDKPQNLNLNDISKLYHSSLMVNREAQNYLKNRGIKELEIFKKYQIGYCDGRKLNSTVVQSVEQKQQLYKLGLLNDKGNESFYKCITFPLLDTQGQVLGFYGRSIEGKRHCFTKNDRKGLFNAKACEKVDTIILAESIIDTLSLIQLGFMNVLPIYGTNGHTDSIADFLKSLDFEELVIFLDNDEAGLQATQDLAELYKQQKRTVSIAHLPDGIKDINEFLSNGAERSDLEEALENRELYFEVTPQKPETQSGLTEQQDSQMTFQYNELTYRVKSSSKDKESMKFVLTAIKENKKHIDRVDLYSDRNRRSFASQVEAKCEIQSSKVEEDLLNILTELEELPSETPTEPTLKTTHKISSTDREKAIKYLKSKSLMEKILGDIETLGYVGQDREKLLLYLSATARITEHPIHISIQSSSSSGKSAMMEAVISMFPPEQVENFSRISGQSLYYMNSLKHKVIIVDERSGAEEAECALRSLMSRNRLDLAVVQKDDKGNYETKVREVEGPTTVWDSTTHTISEDNRNRAFECFMNESKEQTRKIQNKERDSFGVNHWDREEFKDNIRKLHQNAQRLLEPLKVEIPYIHLIEFPDISTRARRDFKRFLYLIATIALLHQHQRERKRSPKGTTYIEATLDDYSWAYYITHDILTNSYSLFNRDARDLLSRLQRVITGEAKEQSVEPEQFSFSRRDVRLWTRWSEFKVRQCMGELSRMEVLKCEGANRGRGGFRYKLVLFNVNLQQDLNLTSPDILRSEWGRKNNM
jgi:DNA primase catalytic core